jgi:chemotaxis protein histidine kinase CheA
VEDLMMRRGTSMLCSAIPLMSSVLLAIGCASHALVPKEQAVAIKARDRTLSSHSAAIHAAIRQSGSLGALAFLDPTDGHLVILPGNSPRDAWVRHTASRPVSSVTGRESVPAVVSFVYRADVPKAPETVTYLSLQEEREERQTTEGLRMSLTALETELRDEQQRTEEKLGAVVQVQRQLSDSMTATRQEQESLTAARDAMQKALSSVAEDLAAARKFMLQTAKLGWLNHELSTENANDLRRIASASQELTANSARLAETMRQLSDSLANQLKELADRLDSIQTRLGKMQ